MNNCCEGVTHFAPKMTSGQRYWRVWMSSEKWRSTQHALPKSTTFSCSGRPSSKYAVRWLFAAAGQRADSGQNDTTWDRWIAPPPLFRAMGKCADHNCIVPRPRFKLLPNVTFHSLTFHPARTDHAQSPIRQTATNHWTGPTTRRACPWWWAQNTLPRRIPLLDRLELPDDRVGLDPSAQRHDADHHGTVTSDAARHPTLVNRGQQHRSAQRGNFQEAQGLRSIGGSVGRLVVRSNAMTILRWGHWSGARGEVSVGERSANERRGAAACEVSAPTALIGQKPRSGQKPRRRRQRLPQTAPSDGPEVGLRARGTQHGCGARRSADSTRPAVGQWVVGSVRCG